MAANSVDSAPLTQAKTRLFISYSRVDTVFVNLLKAALEGRGYDVSVDTSDIQNGEEWLKRIKDLIVDAALIIFVMSPDSLASSVCGKEIDWAKSQHKRIIPLMFRQIRTQVPDALRERHWVRFDEIGHRYEPVVQARRDLQSAKQSRSHDLTRAEATLERATHTFIEGFAAPLDFGGALKGLVDAINLDDVLWEREAASWLSRARGWDEGGRNEGQVLRSTDITSAQNWQNRRPAHAQPIAPVICAYLEASIDKEAKDREALAIREHSISQTRQKLFAEESRKAFGSFKCDSALRLALAGAPSADERTRQIQDASTRLASVARAAQATNLVRLFLNRASINSVVFCSRTGRCAYASDDWYVRLLEPKTYAEIRGFAHDGPVRSVVFAPDGSWLAALSSHLNVMLCDLTSEENDKVLLELDHPVSTIAFNHESSCLIAGFGKSLRLLNLPPNEHAGERWIPAHVFNVTSVAASPTGDLLVCVGLNAHEIHISGGGSHKAIKGRASIHCVAISPQADKVAWGDEDGLVWFSKPAQDTQSVALAGHSGRVLSIAFSCDGNLLASTSVDRTLRIWSLKSREEVACFCGHEEAVLSAAFTPDGHHIASSSSDGSLRIWDIVSGPEIARLESGVDLAAPVLDIHGEFRDVIGAITKDGTLQLWAPTNKFESSKLTNHLGGIECAAFNPSNSSLGIGGKDGTVALWTPGLNDKPTPVGRHSAAVTDIAFSPDGACFASSGEDQAVRVWDSTDAREITALQTRRGTVRSVIFSPNSQILAFTAFDSLEFWNRVSGGTVRIKNARSIVFSPANTHALVGTSGGPILGWDLVSNTECFRLPGHEGPVGRLAISPDGTRLASVGHDDTVRIWDLASRRETAQRKYEGGDRFRTLAREMHAVAFGPDGSRIAYAHGDKNIRLWDSSTGEIIAEFIGHQHWVAGLAFSRDGTTLASWALDKTVRVWDVSRTTEPRPQKITDWTAPILAASKVLYQRSIMRHFLFERGSDILTAVELDQLRPIAGDMDGDVLATNLSELPLGVDDRIDAELRTGLDRLVRAWKANHIRAVEFGLRYRHGK